MKTERFVVLSIAAAALAMLPVVARAADAPRKSGDELVKQLDLLFVQSAVSRSFDGQRLSLALAGPTHFFSDRPARLGGHRSTQKCLGSWQGGKDSFATDPPNATLSIVETDDTVNAVAELTDPRREGTTVSYSVSRPWCRTTAITSRARPAAPCRPQPRRTPSPAASASRS